MIRFTYGTQTQFLGEPIETGPDDETAWIEAYRTADGFFVVDYIAIIPPPEPAPTA